MEESDQSPQQTPQLTQNPTPEQPVVVGSTPLQPVNPIPPSNQATPISPAQISPQPPIQNKSFKKLLLAIVIVAVILALGLVGWLFTKKSNTSSSSKTDSPTTTKPTIDKATLLDTASWTSFDSKIYGISVKIPSGWTAVDLPLTTPYPGVIISSPPVTLGQKSGDGKNLGVLSIRIRTSKVTTQNNNFFQTNQIGSLGKCEEFSAVTIGDKEYKIARTAFSLNNEPKDPYNDKSIFDTLYINSECTTSKYSDSANSLKPNFKVDQSDLLLTASANFDTAKTEQRGNSSTTIPFTVNELSSNKSLETFTTILTSIKTK